jgi:hypothetical protein
MSGASPAMFPDDALKKAEEKGIDHYADLTDEEREAEGLPPRPGNEEPPAAEGGGEDEGAGGEGGEGDGLSGATIDDLMAEIEGLKRDLGKALGKGESADEGGEGEEDELLTAALEHDDPVVRGLAERHEKYQAALQSLIEEARETKVGQQLAKDNADFDAVAKNYAIEGNPLTQAQIERVEDYLLENPALAPILTIEEATLRVFPNAERIRRQPDKGAAPAPGGKQPAVATVVAEGGGAGPPAGPWKPRATETIESAVEEAGRRLGLKR